MPVARVSTPPPYSAPAPTWRNTSDTEPILAAVPPPRYDGVIRACDFPSFIVRIGDGASDGAGDGPVLPWDSVGQLTRALQGRALADPRIHGWTESFREQLSGVDQITRRMRTSTDPVAFEHAYGARAPFPITCTPEMHAALAAYYEAMDAFLVDLPQLLSGEAALGVAPNLTPRDETAAGEVSEVSEVSDGQQALMRLTQAAQEVDVLLGALPPPSWRPPMLCTALSLLVGLGGIAGAVCLPPMSDDPQRPSNASMVLRVLTSFLGFVPFFVLSARRAYLDDSDGEAFRKLKLQIANVQTELGRFSEIVRREAAAGETTAP